MIKYGAAATGSPIHFLTDIPPKKESQESLTLSFSYDYLITQLPYGSG